MNIKIRNASDDPIYLQIKNQVKAEILSGALEPGERLPSIRFLAKELRIRRDVCFEKRRAAEDEKIRRHHEDPSSLRTVFEHERELNRRKEDGYDECRDCGHQRRVDREMRDKIVIVGVLDHRGEDERAEFGIVGFPEE